MRGKSKTGEPYFNYVCRGRQDSICDLPCIRVAHLEVAAARPYATVRMPTELRSRLEALFVQAIRGHGDQDVAAKTLTRRRLAELERQEDRYIEPATPSSKTKCSSYVKLCSLIQTLRVQVTALWRRIGDLNP
jgi:hypothetical protein